MNPIRFLGAALALVAGCATPAFAQTEIVAQPNPDADRLANDMRVLAAEPKNIDALLDAGIASAELGDTSAALAFFQRAESVEPGNPRIAAGRGMALVRLERPGEALRLFQAAEARGLPASRYAADRGFAYDLLGQPGLAQRDYKLAIASGDREDETVRRYALSLGIAGDRDEAMRVLDPLLRKSDRASWRARAFILAMTGDIPGAEKIAASMMPGTMGQALTPFFRRLANLGPADRAFAVHFGELSPTQARLADARLAPDLPRYVPASGPVQLAAAQPVVATPAPAPAPAGKDRRPRKQREEDERKAAAAAIEAARRPAPVQVARADPEADLPPPPRFTQPQTPMVQPIPAPTRGQEPVEAAGHPRPTPAAAAPVVVARAEPAPPVMRPESRPEPAKPRPEPSLPGPAKVGQEDSILAGIVGNITIPADELAAVTATPDQPVAPEPEPAPVRVAEAKPPAVAKPRPEPAKKPEPATTRPDARKSKDTAAVDTKKGKADGKGKKPEPKKPDPAKTDPARVWVQVAGGANEATLTKAWKGVVAKAPAAMKGRSAWTTPLRATNRVLAGPFRSTSEAQGFVNTLGKAGVSAFVFTSDIGQKVTKLGL